MQLVPFQQSTQLNHELDNIVDADDNGSLTLPGHPLIDLSDTVTVNTFIAKDLSLTDLEDMSPHLWMLSKQDCSSISPLHRQRVKSREVVVSEDPRLHLVWFYDRIFIKPLPRYLLSYHFWQEYLVSPTSPLQRREELYKAALGYMRTYTHLIRHESDFYMALDLRLLPGDVTWKTYCEFVRNFGDILDCDVAGRYAYGEIRLTRLNLYCKLFLGKRHFQRVYTQYGTYFGRYYAPVLFVFGMLSVILSALQLEMAVEQLYVEDQWISFWHLCRIFSIFSCSVLFVVVVCMLGLFAYQLSREWAYAIRDRRKRKGNQTKIVGDFPRSKT